MIDLPLIDASSLPAMGRKIQLIVDSTLESTQLAHLDV